MMLLRLLIPLIAVLSLAGCATTPYRIPTMGEGRAAPTPASVAVVAEERQIGGSINALETYSTGIIGVIFDSIYNDMQWSKVENALRPLESSESAKEGWPALTGRLQEALSLDEDAIKTFFGERETQALIKQERSRPLLILRPKFFLDQEMALLRLEVFAEMFSESDAMVFRNRLFAEERCFLNLYLDGQDTELPPEAEKALQKAVSILCAEVSALLAYDLSNAGGEEPNLGEPRTISGQIIRKEGDRVWVRAVRQDLISSREVTK